MTSFPTFQFKFSYFKNSTLFTNAHKSHFMNQNMRNRYRIIINECKMFNELKSFTSKTENEADSAASNNKYDMR